jgi:hypothetical protein
VPASLSAFPDTGYTDTPYVKDLNWNIRDNNGVPQTQKSPWHVHDPKRPRPAKVAGGSCLTPPAPADADVLFDGTEASVKSAWKPNAPKQTLWKVKRGADGATLVSGSGDIVTQKSYGDAQFHIEWRVPADIDRSKWQGGNSGVFLQGTYEVQIYESHSVDIYADGPAASIYGQFPPQVNATLPAGNWQSYDIIFTAPRFDEKGKLLSPAWVTVLHNGVVVQANQPLNGPTRWRNANPYKKHPQRLPLRLQYHGDAVEFRNIWIRDLDKIKAANAQAEADVLAKRKK